MAWTSEEQKPKNPRKARKAKSLQASKLAEALNFVGVASNESGLPFQAHSRMAGHWIVATDGAMTAGHLIEEDLAVCPHTGRLIDALNKAGATLALTARDNGTLMVAGDKLKAIVPCIPGDTIPAVGPDPNCATIDDRIKEGFAKLVTLLKLEADRTFEMSILLRNNSMFACNGNVIFEYWHGIDLPPWGMSIPKAFVAAVAKQPKKLTGFGFGNASVTFYYEDGAWIKTQLFRNDWPDVDKLFAVTAFPAPVPDGLFEGVAAIASFSEDGGVHFHEGKIKTTYDRYRGEEDAPVYGASYEVPGLQGGHSFTAKLLKLIEPVCNAIDYTSIDDRAVFEGDMLRGVLMKRSTPAPPPPPVQWATEQEQRDHNGGYTIAEEQAQQTQPWTGWKPNTDLEDDVPF
jgi:hypothetical protein